MKRSILKIFASLVACATLAFGFTACENTDNATPNVLYDVSADGTYAEVIGCEDTATRIKIANTYKGLPVTAISDRAFLNNAAIVSVVIPKSATSIGDYAFCGCSNLTNITIPDSVTSIGNSAFENCSSLTSLTIPDSVTSIGDNAFSLCSQLQYNTFEKLNYLGNKKNPCMVVLSPVSRIVSEYEISSTAKIILTGAFYDCIYLTNITIPDGVISISSSAFKDCSNLTSITIPDSVTSIGSFAFDGCSSLKSITIPKSVTSIGNYAFNRCSSLTKVYYGGTAEEWAKISNIDNSYLNLTSATWYYYSETKPKASGNYWHYVNGVPTIWN